MLPLTTPLPIIVFQLCIHNVIPKETVGEVTCPPGKEVVPSPSDDSAYYLCSFDGKLQLQFCPPNEKFDETLERCLEDVKKGDGKNSKDFDEGSIIESNDDEQDGVSALHFINLDPDHHRSRRQTRFQYLGSRERRPTNSSQPVVIVTEATVNKLQNVTATGNEYNLTNQNEDIKELIINGTSIVGWHNQTHGVDEEGTTDITIVPENIKETDRNQTTGHERTKTDEDTSDNGVFVTESDIKDLYKSLNVPYKEYKYEGSGSLDKEENIPLAPNINMSNTGGNSFEVGSQSLDNDNKGHANFWNGNNKDKPISNYNSDGNNNYDEFGITNWFHNWFGTGTNNGQKNIGYDNDNNNNWFNNEYRPNTNGHGANNNGYGSSNNGYGSSSNYNGFGTSNNNWFGIEINNDRNNNAYDNANNNGWSNNSYGYNNNGYESSNNYNEFKNSNDNLYNKWFGTGSNDMRYGNNAQYYDGFGFNNNGQYSNVDYGTGGNNYWFRRSGWSNLQKENGLFDKSDNLNEKDDGWGSLLVKFLESLVPNHRHRRSLNTNDTGDYSEIDFEGNRKDENIKISDSENINSRQYYGYYGGSNYRPVNYRPSATNRPTVTNRPPTFTININANFRPINQPAQPISNAPTKPIVNGNPNNNNNMNPNNNVNNNYSNNVNNNYSNNINYNNIKPALHAPCDPRGDLYYPNIDDCSTYFTCNHGSMVLTHCPRGHYYIPERSRCEGTIPQGCKRVDHIVGQHKPIFEE